jgi:rhodanese-related sulfurtransferase
MKSRLIFEILGILAAALVCAAIANNLAARTRKLAWAADYPNAMTVTRRVEPPPDSAPIAPVPVATAQVTPAPAATPDINAGSMPSPQPGATAALTPAASPTPTPTPKPAKVFAPHPDKPWVEIGYADVRDLYDRGALFIDARRTDVYAAGHIRGARSMSVWEADIDARVNALYSEGRDQQQPIVIYCSGGNCEDSHMLSQKLWGLGFDNVWVYKDGFPDWQKRGGAVATGNQP